MTKNPETSHESILLRPILHTGAAFYVTVAALLVALGWFGYAWWTQLTQGLSVTGMGDIGTSAGAPWGLYVSTFLWWGGIAYGGIAISATVRVMKLEQYKPIARIAELLTVVALPVAGMSIVFDVGRPERFFNLIAAYGDRIGYSPLIWDITVIVAYFVLSVTYLLVNMREDLVALTDRLPKRWKFLYGLVTVGYNPEETETVQQLSRWLALSLLVLTALLSGGVVSWLFGLIHSQPGWFGALQGPSFLAVAMSSAIAAVILVAATVRRVFRWQQHITEEIFRGLGKILAVGSLVYLWLILQDQLTIQYAGSPSERAISNALLFGEFAPAFWTTIGVMIAAFAYFAIQALRPSAFSLSGSALAAFLLLIVFWTKRFLIVVPSLVFPRLPYPAGSYTPTWVEWSLLLGTVAAAVFLYTLFAKVYPLMEYLQEPDR